jgi:hypothetical protein
LFNSHSEKTVDSSSRRERQANGRLNSQAYYLLVSSNYYYHCISPKQE